MQWEGKGSKRNSVGLELEWKGRVKGRERKKVGMEGKE